MADIVGSMQDAVQSARDQAAELADLARANVEDAVDRLQNGVNDNPLTALGVVLAIGFVLAVLLRRPQVKILYVRESA